MSRSNKLILAVLLPALLFVAGCKQLTTTQGAVIDSAAGLSQAIQLSSEGIDAAEPVTAAAPDGSFYVAWVNHDARQADVMISHFSGAGKNLGMPARVYGRLPLPAKPKCVNLERPAQHSAWQQMQSCPPLSLLMEIYS